MPNCLICGIPTPNSPIVPTRFPGLTNGILYSVYSCDQCDFAFAYPRPLPDEASRWYRSTSTLLPETNPQSASVQRQVERIAVGIPDRLAPINILDLGCGAGDLIRSLKNVFPNAQLLGLDVFDAPTSQDFTYSSSISGIRESLTGLSRKKLDILIMSHVLEHFSDFQLVEEAVSLLAIGGTMYVEVPDAYQYSNFSREQIFYYFDGTHINHFSTRSLFALFSRLECCPSRVFLDSFDYVDGNPYPVVAVSGVKTRALSERLSAYIDHEQSRVHVLQTQLSNLGEQGVAVWGVGQNFLRLDELGVFRDCKRLFLLDGKRAGEELRLRSKEKFVVIQNPQDFLENESQVPIFVSSTWHYVEIAKQIKEFWPNAQVFRL